MKNITQWQHFKKNYLAISIGMIVFSIVIAANIEPESKWVAILVLLIGVVIVPVGNYLSWKKWN